jgi:hypothetical protein
VNRVLSKHEARHIPGCVAEDSWRRSGWCALVGNGFTTSLVLRCVGGGGVCQRLLVLGGWGPQGIVRI